MSTKEKLIERFKKVPDDFTFDELVRVFSIFGFMIDNKGHTSGSRVRFIRQDMFYACHRPHPGNIVKKAVIRDALTYLQLKGLL